MAPQCERRPITVLLDGVESYQQIGELFRLCAAFRVQRLVICWSRFSINSRRLAKASRGTHRNVPWSVADDAFQVVMAAKNYGIYVIAISQGTGSIDLRDLHPEFPVMIVLRGDQRKPDQRLMDWADTVVCVPTISMPLATVPIAAILLHEVTYSLSHRTLTVLQV
jgi:tRNA G18 (ribose-2'-O)-methylase SpoU